MRGFNVVQSALILLSLVFALLATKVEASCLQLINLAYSYKAYDRHHRVKYFSESVKDNVRVEVGSDGRLRQQGQILSFYGKRLYTVDENGEVYIFQGVVKKYHHSSPVSGGPVAGAGRIIVQQGLVTHLDRGSGHYQPPEYILDQTYVHLWCMGADLSECVVARGNDFFPDASR